MGQTGCPETSARKFHYTLRNTTEERISQAFVVLHIFNKGKSSLATYIQRRSVCHLSNVLRWTITKIAPVVRDGMRIANSPRLLTLWVVCLLVRSFALCLNGWLVGCREAYWFKPMTQAEGYSKRSESVRQTTRLRIQNHSFIHNHLHKNLQIPQVNNFVRWCFNAIKFCTCS